jgi:hypothetical protein
VNEERVSRAGNDGWLELILDPWLEKGNCHLRTMVENQYKVPRGIKDDFNIETVVVIKGAS